MSLGLSDAQLTMMRNQVEQLLPDTCIIEANSPTASGGYWGDDSWSAVSGGTVACRVDPINSASDEISYNLARETISELYQLTVPYDAPLQAHYRVVISSVAYEMVQIDTGHSWNVSRRAVIRRTVETA